MNRSLLAVASVGALLAVPGASGSRALASAPALTLFTDGTVLALASVGDTTYVGGDFTLIGAPTGSWVGVDGAGKPLPDRPVVQGIVDSAARDGHGGWFLAGTIAAVGGTRASARITHLRADGTIDRRWHAVVRGGPVDDLALRGRTLFLGGRFVSVDGKAHPSLAAVRASNGHVLPWRPQGAPQRVKGHRRSRAEVTTLALSRDGRTLFLAGSFTHIAAAHRRGLAAVTTATGRVTSWNPSPNGPIFTIDPAEGSGNVYIGGSFTRIGGARRSAVAAVDATRGRSTRFNAHAPTDASVYDVVATRSALYVAGDFGSLGGASRHLVAAVDPATGAVTSWEPALTGDYALTLALDPQGTTVYVGGKLTGTATARRDGLVAVDARSGAVKEWDVPTLGDVYVVQPGADGAVFVGGDLAFVGGARRPGLAAVAPGGAVTTWTPPLSGIIRSLAPSANGSQLFVGGAFTPAETPSRKNLAVLTVSSGELHAFGDGTNSGVWALAPTPDGSRLYIGGAFVTVGGVRRPHIAALDAHDGGLLSWNSGANDLVRALVATSDGVFLGGDFTNAGGAARARLVFLDAGSGRATGWNPGADDSVWALVMSGSALYTGGEFTQIGGKPRNSLASVDIESGDATGWDPSPDDTVRALRTSPDAAKLYAGGAFAKMGRARRGYAEFLLPDGSLSGWGPTDAWDTYAVGVSPTGAVIFGGRGEGLGGVDIFR